jgi:hypothetical protein
VTLTALFYGEENWRGRRVWNKYRQQLEERGEQLDFRFFLPKPVADEQNFAATPFVKSWFKRPQPASDDTIWQDRFSQVQAMVPSPPSPGLKNTRQFLDLAAYQAAFENLGPATSNRVVPVKKVPSGPLDAPSRGMAAQAVLKGLKETEGSFEALRVARNRPHSAYPIVYDLDNPWGILLPHLKQVSVGCLRLRLKACAELAAGQPERALDDLKLLLTLGNSVKEEPMLISYLVRLACLEKALQPLWEGLAERRWSEAQLSELQRLFEQYDFVADLKLGLNGERAAGILTAELLYRHKYNWDSLDTPGLPNPSGLSLGALIGRIAPHGWYYLETFNYCRLYELQISGTFDPRNKRVFPEEVERQHQAFEQERTGRNMGQTVRAALHHQILASLLLPSVNNLLLKAAAGQTETEEAALACALERYRLANGHFPDQLESLTPKFAASLPHDVITGEPYKYRRSGEGAFLLYSVGWNGKEDNGIPGKKLYDEKHGDWVWNSSPPGERSP